MSSPCRYYQAQTFVRMSEEFLSRHSVQEGRYGRVISSHVTLLIWLVSSPAAVLVATAASTLRG